MNAAPFGVKRVLHAGVTGAQVEIADENLRGLIHIQHGHPVDGGIHRIAGGRVEHVVGADHDHGIGVFEVAVDRIHLVKLLVRHVGLRQQHVHVPGHAAGDGMDGVTHFRTVRLKLVGQLADQVLCLRQGHSVSGNDDYRPGITQDFSGRRLTGLLIWRFAFRLFHYWLGLDHFFPRNGGFPG
ncbi:hypothetical protein SDC9_100840 [bioreactor metagenome]|uniref:Uncharacterized protein n=1 Tax=bioreactor metagenome TaxID=1076179 RepID=A0A645ALZ8_9ZZZZ